MDYKKVESFDKGIIIKGVDNFELAHIFECGQCFRWNKQESGNYIGVAYGKVIEIEKNEMEVKIYNINGEEFEKIWCDYFDLKREYTVIKEKFRKDPLLERSVNFGYGIRLLQQEPFELTISFIISSNNRIPMIKRAINRLSEKWGKAIEYKGETYYTFPTAEELDKASIEEIQSCGLGFRSKYVKDAVHRIYEGEINLEFIKSCDDDICHQELQKLSGIGPKVSDCIMLFSMQKYSAFPVDVWVKRAMQFFYLAPDVSLPKIRIFARDKFENLAGFAQQYLFYYARENNIKIE
ncbi:DNA-3-methyladenine glycosylase family protein [Clostridium estertheticum]|uniref:DNA-(apurinic or apyrimidinic site) lyase n=2 Tax=Clostridium estertheticum TaxID=238834 RepID=A0A1J0GBX6_9CLOT|nr:DNA glycosylase [Clostridium estertheticum]APC38861.1 8-oxoguanine DNA glycosylase [Clostridium estertheticum subsp. estertheticum]MBU3173585.1 8-oxoguanine DNA glycosylase [Clostridium estertheticum]MBZ9615196.1 DNA-3-methyladenine glycosylase [Clostridium estertheticum subsp. laramiense]MCB2342525.1 DNA-3-methyladenine glycosylase [Clostridium estertheticum]MPQ30098.1 DNA-3-methyladenine glycosylase 2 family protein [Clostridium estertheticum]